MSIQTIIPVILAILVVIVLGLIIAVMVNRLRSRNLREKYGAEYDYTVEKTGDKRSAETDLKEREKRVNDLQIHPLGAEDKQRYHSEWNDIQAGFIDNPLGATQSANRVITEVMIARGFPVADFEERSADLSVLYPNYVTGYREASYMLTKSQNDGVSTEELRQAMVKFHTLFDVLIEYSHQQERQMEANIHE